ncbi:sulfotransferase family 2 domain-containing protein [Ideonella sp.]|uniref:sulfotransferase family 2 domain-containing protein n=1 Tax=Ideonella sp. TaxID=1929293 RepID=UPI003BB5E713
MKHLILHFHLFKNGGTSLDAILKSQFPGSWVTKEFDGLAAKRAAQLKDWLLANQDATVFSSHTAWMPVPQIPGVNIIPLVFVRHPIDRIASAYSFERKLNNPSNYGAQLAQRVDFRQYVLERLADKADRQCRNFQTRRLSDAVISQAPERERALRAVQTLPFVGVVESYERSMRLLEVVLQPHFPWFRAQVVRANQSDGREKSLDARLAQVRAALGDEVYDTLMGENADDLAVHAAAWQQLDARILPSSDERSDPADDAPALSLPAPAGTLFRQLLEQVLERNPGANKKLVAKVARDTLESLREALASAELGRSRYAPLGVFTVAERAGKPGTVSEAAKHRQITLQLTDTERP